MTKMDRSEQLAYLISYLAPGAKIPSSDLDRWSFFRALANVREPGRVSSEFLEVQDELLQAEIAEKGITPAFNLPSEYVIHTVGPQIISVPCEEEQQQLASCYTSCLNAAACKNINSIALCCISTGEFKFPQKEAARIAIQTVSEWLLQAKEPLHVVYCVFTQADTELYADLLHL